MNLNSTKFRDAVFITLAALCVSATPSSARESAEPELRVEARNPLAIPRPSATIELPWKDLQRHLPGLNADNVSVWSAGEKREIVAQGLDSHGDKTPDSLLFQADFAPHQVRKFIVRSVASQLPDGTPSPVHAKFVPTRMDDFAWESDRIAYRVYGPALRVENVSNGIDVWCKRVRYPIVEKWYQPGVNYHADHGEGADLFKVGETLGCGGSAIWKDGQLYRGENFATWRILANGPVRTLFELTYEPLVIDGVTIRETKQFSIDAGHNLTRIATVYRCDPPAKTLEFAAGLVKRPNVNPATGGKQPWIALWGPLEAAGNGDLGTGVVMSPDAFSASRAVGEHLLAIGKAETGKPAVYWAGAGWTRSGDFSSADDWNQYLDRWARRVAQPLDLRIAGHDAPDGASTANVRRIPIAKGWARNAVNAVIFRQHALTTHKNTQYTAFYDAQGQMTLAKRRLGSTEWEMHATGIRGNVRDAHNCISVAVDGAGVLHVAWDHHGSPLHYARGSKPGGLELSAPVYMTGDAERNVTYPEFFNLPDGGLLFMYRAGGSGRGNTMLNRYDPATSAWSIVQHPLIDGEGRRNAYTNQIAIDKSGVWHLSWCWRESGDVASNHDICYARSADGGRTWTRSDGRPYQLPITAATAEVAYPVPQGHEYINQCSTAVDGNGRPMIATYWRPTGTRVPQYHLVWHDGKAWQVAPVSRRKTPFSLSGGGTKRIPISRPKLAVGDDGSIHMLFRDAERGNRVSVATTDDPQRKSWHMTDLTRDSVGLWEPSFDRQLWRTRGELHVSAQRVGQGDAETLEDVPPQMISVLEWKPE
jgi:hypothetical protein